MAGLGYSNRDIESRAAAGHLVPVAGFRLDYHPESRQPVRVLVDVALAPYVDTYIAVPYQRFTLAGTFDWRPSDAWRLGASLSAALVPKTVLAPEFYGNAGVSASFAPISFLILSVGGFSQAQFQGTNSTSDGFLQWTAYFSVAFRERFGL